MPTLLRTLQRVPGIPIQIQNDRLRDEQERVDDREDRKKVVDQPCGELGIRGEQHEDEESPCEGRHAVQNDRDFRDFLGQPFVPIPRSIVLSAQPTQNLAHDDEDRRPENKRGEEDVELRHDPDSGAVPAERKSVRLGLGKLRIGGRHAKQQDECHRKSRRHAATHRKTRHPQPGRVRAPLHPPGRRRTARRFESPDLHDPRRSLLSMPEVNHFPPFAGAGSAGLPSVAGAAAPGALAGALAAGAGLPRSATGTHSCLATS